jgi:hypothetical protein
METNVSPHPTPIPDPQKCTEHKALCSRVEAIVKRQDKTETRRWSLMAALAGSVVCVIVAMVTMGVSYGGLEADIEDVEDDEREDRSEIRRLREDMLAAERRDVEQNRRVLETVTEIKTKLNSLDRRVENIESIQVEGARRRKRGRRND